MSDDADTAEESGGEDANGQAPSPGAGERLRHARESRGLSLAEVSVQLRLDARLLTALEEDDHARLPGATYAIGYVRAYARLLKLDEDEMAALAGSTAAAREELLPENVDLGRPRSAALPGGLLALLVVVVAAAALAGWWWLGRTTAPLAGQPTASGLADGGAVTPSPESPARAAVAEAPPKIPPEVLPEVHSVLPSEGAAVAATESRPETPPPVEAVAATPETAPVVATPPATLVFEFDEDSWLEVTDATGAVLAYQMGEAEERISLRGSPPFEVLLGYAPGVTITYNGQPFDPTPYVRGDVARLRIGATAPGAGQ